MLWGGHLEPGTADGNKKICCTNTHHFPATCPWASPSASPCLPPACFLPVKRGRIDLACSVGPPTCSSAPTSDRQTTVLRQGLTQAALEQDAGAHPPCRGCSDSASPSGKGLPWHLYQLGAILENVSPRAQKVREGSLTGQPLWMDLKVQQKAV